MVNPAPDVIKTIVNEVKNIDGFSGGGVLPPPNISYNPPKQNVHPSKKISTPPTNIRHNK